MNKLFVKSDLYGDLFYDEVFLYYDGPCIFSVKNILGYRFICLLESEEDSFDRYLVVPVSIMRYNLFVKNNWSIRNLYTQSEQGGVFTVTFYTNRTKIINVTLAEIEQMHLPKENEMLEYNEGYTTKEILLDSTEKGVPVIQKSLEKDGEHRQYIYASELARESLQFQKIFDGIAADEINKESKNGEVSKEKRNEIKKSCQIPIYGTYAASFGIKIEGTELTSLLEEETLFTKYLKIYFEIINANEDASEIFLEEHQNALIALKNYYKTLISLHFAIKMNAATPKHEHFKFHFTKEEIINRYRKLNCITKNEVEQITLEGTWMSIDYERKLFKFKTTDGRTFSGKFDDDFAESVFDFDKKINVLLETKKTSTRIGYSKDKNTLLSII